jgi:peptide deformylase
MHYIPDPVLRERARKIRKRDDPALRKLVDDMVDSMYYYEGIGIAANQVGSLKRVCVIQMPEDEEPTVLLNLTITRKDGEREVTEGCLSLPGWQGRILRAEKVWARAIDMDGNPVRFRGVDELLAQALEHECDHLDGLLFTDHLRSKDDLYEVEEGEEEEGEGTVPVDNGSECHDCGEVFAPGVSTAPCVEQGHYVAATLDCPV